MGVREREVARESTPVAVNAPTSPRILVILAVLVAIVDQAGRPMPALWPRRDPDLSWMVGLQLMRSRGLPFGSDGAFTYGPWGFLTAPTGIDLSDLWLAGLFRAAAVALLFLALKSCFPQRRWTIPVAVAATLLMGNCNQAGWLLMLAVAAAVLGVLAHARPVTPAMVAVVAALGAFSFQVKASEGVLCMAFLGLMVLASRSLRVWITAAGSFVVAFVILWLAAGQRVSDIPGWLRLTIEIVRGYGDSLAYPTGGWVTWLMVVGSVVAVLALVSARQLPLLARVGGLGMLLFLLKAALTRADAAHLLPGYSGVLVVVVVALAASVPRAVQVVVAPVAAVMALLLTVNLPILPSRELSPAAWPLDALPDQHAKRLTQVRSDLVDELGIGDRVLAELEGHPVSIDPWEISAVWAHDLDWQPLPVFQHYAATSSELDETNAAALLADPRHRVLREAGAYDDRRQAWDTPAATLALICHFEEATTQGDWSVFARIDDRCAIERTLSTQRVEAGVEVDLPEPDDALLAVRFTPDSRSLTDRLIGISGYQRGLLHATVDGTTSRLPESLAGGPLIVGSSEDEPVLFEATPARTISFDRSGILEVVEIPLLGRESE